MAKSEYTDLTYFMIYGYKLVKNSDNSGRQYLESISGLHFKEKISFILNASDLRHIYKEHYGSNEKDTGNNIPLTDKDIRSLVDVICSPDQIVYGLDKKDGRKIFYFLKDSGNGAYNLAEVYSDKHGNLTAKTFYKTKKGSHPRAVELINSFLRILRGRKYGGGAHLNLLFQSPSSSERRQLNSSRF